LRRRSLKRQRWQGVVPEVFWLMSSRTRSANADGREKMPTRGTFLRASKTGHHLEQRLDRILRRQIDRKSASSEFAVPLRVLNGRRRELFNPARFFAFRRRKPVEAV